MEKVSNKTVLQLIGAEEKLVKSLKQRKMRFAGHVLRGSSGSLVNLVLEGSIEGKRDRGRQRRVWGDDVKEWSRSASFGQAKRTAEKRERWCQILSIENCGKRLLKLRNIGDNKDPGEEINRCLRGLKGRRPNPKLP
ncbi:hypothetical protein GQR58_009842 [Nymphon striatum]|nr:hypothetical protein GQR58_009842 [Nymphon striatum]